ncbi:exodeoxyribonuclease VII small subunit [Legionella gratiana]|uniref:Exodeoxyribonuclease 7 small subunit n=1 Tax=Legionella gratiana TaxID=45066 RepID=A0A378JE58_9GAMM|nr:exodeoxyribonuclease VII small subunit [Legionella gratiana]KTD15157.1 exodeoxyribonuclease VII small subunit [Legionella gratiana]STX46082.1 exodeoxyribonuclease VII small subunit [Legionella gratiana]
MSKSFHFEQSITELEEIVRQLEKGELSLEDSLKQFEKGISLARHCQDTLLKAEQKIELLTTAESSSDEELSD